MDKDKKENEKDNPMFIDGDFKVRMKSLMKFDTLLVALIKICGESGEAPERFGINHIESLLACSEMVLSAVQINFIDNRYVMFPGQKRDDAIKADAERIKEYQNKIIELRESINRMVKYADTIRI